MAAMTEKQMKQKQVSEAETETGRKRKPRQRAVLEDGVYTAEFGTDSSMFHVNEANDKKESSRYKDGKMTIHVVFPRRSVNLFAWEPRMPRRTEQRSLSRPQIQ